MKIYDNCLIDYNELINRANYLKLNELGKDGNIEWLKLNVVNTRRKIGQNDFSSSVIE